MINSPPTAFISHSSEDKSLAQRLAAELRAKGIDAWFDRWEIAPGDSIVQKVFEEGLKNCHMFLVLLSPASVSSQWVKHELDVAIVRRLEGLTRVVPVLISDSISAPVALKPLHWIDLTKNWGDGVQRLADTALGRLEKPAVAEPPSGIHVAVPGLTNFGAIIAHDLAGRMLQDPNKVGMIFVEAADLAKSTQLTPIQLNDGVEELEEKGLIRIRRFFGTSPFNFGMVEPSYRIILLLRGTAALDFNPEDDIRSVAAAAVGLGVDIVSTKKIQEDTGLPSARLNIAAGFLVDQRVVDPLKEYDGGPFWVRHFKVTGATRRFVSQNCK